MKNEIFSRSQRSGDLTEINFDWKLGMCTHLYTDMYIYIHIHILIQRIMYICQFK